MNVREKRIREREGAAPRRLPVIVDGVRFDPPTTRRDCLPGGINAQRPCPWVRCAHHLAIDVTTQGVLLEHGEPESLQHSCALDVAERAVQNARDGHVDATGLTHENTLYAIGVVMGITRERVRQIEALALRRLVTPTRQALDEPDRPVAHIRKISDSVRPTCTKCGAFRIAQVHPDTRPEERLWCSGCRRKADAARRRAHKAEASALAAWSAR